MFYPDFTSLFIDLSIGLSGKQVMCQAWLQVRDRELIPKHNNIASSTGALWEARAHPTALEKI